MGVINRAGSLYLATGIDNSGFRRDAKEAESIINNIGDHAKKAGMLIGGMFAVTGVKDFVTQMVKVRGEIQQLEIAFSTMLGSKEKADVMMADIKKLALSTPFTLTEVADNTKQLIAMGIAADNAIDTVKSLGDVAAGVSIPLSRIAINYGQVSALGKLQSREIRDFAMAGIPIVDELAKMLGKTSAEVYEMVEAGKVGFPEVEQAFKNMSGEGGKFYNLMEKQNASVTGQISKLQDSIQLMFNTIGESNEGMIYSAIGGASKLVENYEEIGKVLAELIVVYGAYKAVLISMTAIKKATSSVHIIEEAKALEGLLTAEQKAGLSKQNLVRGTHEYAVAVKAETAATIESLKTKVESGVADTNILAQKRIAAQQAKVDAAAKVASIKAELAAVIGAAEAEKVASLQKKTAAESEKQSRAALRVVKLQEQKDAVIAQAQALKEAGATQEKIVAKNREIATIHSKIAVAKAEEVQRLKNITAIRAEIAAVTGSTSSKKIESLQKKLDTAITDENTKAEIYNSSVKDVNASKAKTRVAAQRLETISTTTDTAAKNANVKVTGLLSLAKTNLIAVTGRLNKVIMANKFALLAAAAIAAGYAIYKLATYQTEAEKSTKRLNDSIAGMSASIDTEVSVLNILFDRLKKAKEGTKEFDDAKKSIMDKYGSYLNSMSEDVRLLKDLKTAQDELTKAITETARARSRDKFIEEAASNSSNKQNDALKKIRKIIIEEKGKAVGGEIFSDVRDLLRGYDSSETDYNSLYTEILGVLNKNGLSAKELGGHKLTNRIAEYGKAAHELRNAVIDADELAKEAQKKEVKQKEEQFVDFNKQLENSKKKVDDLKTSISNLRRGITPTELKSGEQFDFDKAIEDEEKLLQEAEKKLQRLTGRTDKTSKQANTLSDKQSNHRALLDKQKLDEIRYVENAQHQIEQAWIDAMDDGSDKTIAQMELNFEKELREIDREKEDRLRTIIENAKAVFDAEEDIKASQNKNYQKKTFDPTGITLSDSDNAYFDNRYNFAFAGNAKEREKYIQQEKESWNEYLKEFGNYQQKRQAIIEEYDSKISKAENDAEIKILEATRDSTLDELDNRFSKSTSLIGQLFADASEKSVREINRIIEKARLLQKYLEAAKDTEGNAVIGGNTVSRKDILNLGISEVSLSNLENDPEKIESFTNAIKSLKNELKDRSPVQKFFDDIKKGMDSISKGGIEDIGLGIESIGSAVISFLPQVADLANEINNLFGGEGIADEISLVTDTLGGLGTTAQGVGKMMSGDIIGGAMSAASGIAKTIGSIFTYGDKKHEKRIQKIQEQVEVLDKSYRKLGKSIEKAYSTDASKLIGENNEILEQQKVLIQQQIKEERDKKSTDKGRIKEWEDTINQIDEAIQENIEKAKDVIFGEDIKSAIENFANAYIDAWSAGEDKAKSAKDTVKKMMQQMVTESIKAAISSSAAMEKIRAKLQDFYADGILDEWEQNYVYGLADKLQKELDSQFGWADKLMKDDSSSSQEATRRSYETMSQDTGSEISGRLTAVQQSSEEIKQLTGVIQLDVSELRKIGMSANEALMDLRDISLDAVYHLEKISKNTAQLYIMNEKLEKVVKHTEGLLK